ncbi:MAG TPA: tetratricopeptide repeat protein [Gemmatimonadaceae bacterium]|nr:tetratricopeptide repeat protein [Gemmatimonadaceae bacterium]
MAHCRWLLPAFALVACATRAPRETSADREEFVEATSLLGTFLMRPEIPGEVRVRYEQQLREAQEEFSRTPESADAAIWVGRRLAYLGRYGEAIEHFTRAIERHPRDARLYRHRGHRYITVRRLEAAIADLEHAAELTRGQPDAIEPDGLPNARNIPTSTLQSNIWYHLGLAHYLRGDFRRASSVYREALRVSTNADMLVATTHWAYMTLRRMEEDADARRLLTPIAFDMDIIENDAYHRLVLLYKGEVSIDAILAPADSSDGVQDATVGYGIGNWHLYHGRTAEAQAVFERVVRGTQWAAFGFIAAEAELSRLRDR